MRLLPCLLYLAFGSLIVKAADDITAPKDDGNTQVTGVVSAIDTNTGVIALSENNAPILKVLPRKVSSIVLWTLQIGQQIKVSGIEDKTGTLPSMTITSLDNISQLNTDGSAIAWANPITVAGDPEVGRPPMLAFTAPIRESDAKKAHDDLFERYQANWTPNLHELRQASVDIPDCLWI